MECIAYKDGYKYQLHREYAVKTDILPAVYRDLDYLVLALDGMLTIRKGYAWDGPSGPTIDTKNFMRGSLVHDALYQLMREKVLDPAVWREPADRLLREMCREDGMSAARAWWVYQGVRLGGEKATRPRGGRDLNFAPRECSA